MGRAEEVSEAAARRAAMTKSSIAFTLNPTGEYLPISQVPLSRAHVMGASTSTIGSVSQYERQQRATSASSDLGRPKPDLASSFIAQKTTGKPVESDVPEWAATQGTNINLGSDSNVERFYTSASENGKWQHTPDVPIDLLDHRAVKKVRDKTMDGEHAASLSEAHFLTVHYPFMTDKPKAAASFKSGFMLRDSHRRHTRSAYHPDQKYAYPPSEMNCIGWKISDKYDKACAKFVDGAPWHGRQGSHITKFSERLLLGARHPVSGPLAPRPLHY